LALLYRNLSAKIIFNSDTHAENLQTTNGPRTKWPRI
jgi:hypothetical protein